jgi:hypothetical protein
MKKDDFKTERDSALRSLDIVEIKAYAKKHLGINWSDNETFWASIHKSRLTLDTFSDEEKQLSYNWLLK